MEEIINKIKNIDFFDVLIRIFIACAVFDYFIYIYNAITVIVSYGFLKLWQPVFMNADKLGLGSIYLLIAYLLRKEKGDMF